MIQRLLPTLTKRTTALAVVGSRPTTQDTPMATLQHLRLCLALPRQLLPQVLKVFDAHHHPL